MKKPLIFCRGKELFYPKKLLLIMRLITLLLIVNLLQISAVTYSQSERFNINVERGSIKDVLSLIERQSQYKFLYRDNDIADKMISLQSSDQTIEQLMNTLLEKTGNSFRILDKSLIVIVPENVKQQFRVMGQVTDSNTGEALIGVNVVFEGTTIGAVTDIDGRFSIEVPNANGTLVFTYVGYTSEKVAINNQTNLTIALVPDVKSLEEVVVIGYGTVNKKDLTGAISVVDTREMQKMQSTTVAEAMQGLVAGVNVRNSGRAGSESTIEIRGVGNFSNQQPLYVIDGMPTNASRDFNPNDIESIQILKDASAAAIYGSRAANGVIIITTKKGKDGPLRVEFSGRYGIQTLPKFDLMNAADFKKYNTMAYREAIEVEKFPWIIGQGYQQYPEGIDTDWQKETFKTANVHDYNMSFSGGNQFGNYLVSGNYFGNTGTSIGSSFERYSFRVNSEGKKGIFRIGENLSISNAFSDELITNPHWDMLRMLPTIPIFDPTHPGGFGYGDEAKARTFGVNPFARESLEESTNNNLRLRGVAFAELDIFKFLKYKINAGFEASSEQYKYIRKVGNWTLNQPYDPSMAAENKGRYQSKLIENTLSFNKEFGKHRVDGVIGTTYQTQEYEQIGGVKRNLVYVGGEYYRVLNAGTSNPESSGFINEDALISYLGRLNYSFNGKYFLTGTFRRDGSSKFSKDNRWGNFPSVSVAWRISQEPFFKVPWVNDFKLRANYGTLGNSSIGRWIGYGGSFYGSSVYNIGNWDYMSLLNTSVINVLGRDQHIVNGATQVKLANADLKWETQTQTNFGADLAFLENRLAVTAEYFVSTTKDVLTPMPILLSTGNDGGDPFANAAEIRNRGFELSATWKERRGEFNYSVTANFSTLKNEVLDLGYGKKEYITWMTKTELGEPIGMFYLRKTDGLFRSEQDVLNHKSSSGIVIQPNAKPGDIRYVDFNDDGQINEADRQIVGNPWPVCDLGLNFNMSYKGIDFSMMWYGAFGQDVYNGPRSTAERFDDNSNYFTFRKGHEPYQENPNSDFPRLLYGDDRNSRGDIDRWLEDGSYFKLRNVTLGYTLPKKLLQAAKFEELRVYLTGQNLVTFTKYLGLDPDFTAPDLWRRGHDEVRYPNARAVSLGLQFKF